MPETDMAAHLHIRSYTGEGAAHAHEHVQLVLPIDGLLEIEVAGRGARLSTGLSAIIAPGQRHTQAGLGSNRMLVLDLGMDTSPSEFLDWPAFRPVPQAAQHLVAYAGQVCGAGTLAHDTGGPLAQLLVQALLEPAPRPLRSVALERAILDDPAGDWSVVRMAREVGLGRGQLYRMLAEERQITPARFVLAIRLKAAQAALHAGERSLAQLAAAVGFSDQAALTRAMRRETGQTPGVWRRHLAGTTEPELRTKGQDANPVRR